MNYVLTGFMGCGKTTIGAELAAKLGYANEDTDDLIVKQEGKAITEIFKLSGEEGFRKLETGMLSKLIDDNKDKRVYSTGGGIVMQKENLPLLKKLGTVVFLRVRPETVIARLGKDSTRPLLQGPDKENKVRVLMGRRREAYESCADIIVDVDNKRPAEIAEEIILRSRGKNMKILVINGPNLNFLGIREKAIYGTQSYSSLVDMLRKHARENNIELDIWQSNHEGAIIDKLQQAYYDKELKGIVINPGAYTHYSYAIHDALKSVFVPKVEIHISDINTREEFRKVSVTAPACDKQIIGHGLEGYVEAIDWIAAQ